MANKLESVHLRHQQIRDDQLGFLLLGDCETLHAVCGLLGPMPAKLQHGHYQLARHGVVINN
jgi:hypothetical protein